MKIFKSVSRYVCLLLVLFNACPSVASDIDAAFFTRMQEIMDLAQVEVDPDIQLDLLDSLASECNKVLEIEDRIDLYNKLRNDLAIKGGMEIYTYLTIMISDQYGHAQFSLHDSSLYYINQVVENIPKLKDRLLLKIYHRLATIYFSLDRFEESSKYCFLGLEIAKRLDDKTRMIGFYVNLASYALKYIDHEKSEEYCIQALNIAKESQEPKLLISAYVNYASHLAVFERYEEVITMADSSLFIMEIENINIGNKLMVYFSKAVALSKLNNFTEAKIHFDAAMKIAIEQNFRNRIIQIPLFIGDMQLQLNEYQEAINLANTSLNTYPEILTLFELEKANKLLYDAYKGLGDDTNTLFYLEKWNIYKDSLDERNRIETIANLEIKYKNNEQKKHIDFQDSEIQSTKKQKLIFSVLTGLLSILVIMFIFFYRKLKLTKERIDKQNELINNQKDALMELDQLKSRFFSNMSHELRTPLTLLLGPINSLLKSKSLDKKNLTLLQKSKGGALKIQNLISSISKLSKLESGKLVPNKKPVLLFKLVRGIISSFEPLIQQKKMRIIFNFQADKNITLNLDPSIVKSILENLISNAIKFTKSKGEVNIALFDKGSSIEISIKDNGRGIHPDDLPHIFKRYYQSKDKNLPLEGGSGIGLSLSYELAVSMDASLSARSEQGLGSQFIFEMPREEVFQSPLSILNSEPAESNDTSKESKAQILTKEPIENNKPALLIVEDNYQLRDYLRSILDDQFNIYEAGNGEEGLNILNDVHGKQTIDIVISDIMMPVMDGHQFLRKLKENEKYVDIPVVMLTAKSDIEDRNSALRLGVDDYILKPFEEDELLSSINHLIKNAKERKLFLESEPDSVSLSLSEEDKKWLTELDSFIYGKLNSDLLSVSYIANSFAMSDSTLYRQLKRLTGLSPSNYIHELKLNIARKLLHDRHYKSVTQVAFHIGYKDSSTFSKAFKNRYGKSPSAYMKESSYK